MPGTMHELIRAAIAKGFTNAQALEYAKQRHPYSEMRLATVNYIRNQMRKKDAKIPSDLKARRGK